MIEQTCDRFSDRDKARNFIELIRQEKPRYIRDQVMLIQKAIKNASFEVIDKALNFCLKNRLYSATDFHDAVNHYQKETHDTDNSFEITIPSLTQEDLEKIKVTPKIREMSEYIDALGGNKSAGNN